jgi:hypothetical protein
MAAECISFAAFTELYVPSSRIIQSIESLPGDLISQRPQDASRGNAFGLRRFAHPFSGCQRVDDVTVKKSLLYSKVMK